MAFPDWVEAALSREVALFCSAIMISPKIRPPQPDAREADRTRALMNQFSGAVALRSETDISILHCGASTWMHLMRPLNAEERQAIIDVSPQFFVVSEPAQMPSWNSATSSSLMHSRTA